MSANARFLVIEYDDADEQLKALYDEIMQLMGVPFVPNWFKCQGGNPDLLAASWAKVKAVLLQGQIPRVVKELILHNVSKKRDCVYCATAHGMMADSMSSQLCEVEGFRATADLESEHIPAKYKTAVRIVTKCALDSRSTTNGDFATLRTAGFSDDEIHELMSQADLVNMLITIADIAGIEVDKEMTGA